MPKQAAILIIGNEILSGKIQDSNSAYLAKELRSLGVELREIRIIPDEVTRIAEAVRDFSERFEFVFTSGGVGPTHDDVTMEGIARAFGQKVVRHPNLTKILESWYKHELNEDRLKMAEVPEGSRFLAEDKLSFPAIAFRNVFIFPGVPEIFREKFQAIRESFRETPYYLKNVYVKMPEGKLASYLNQLLKQHPDLLLGSYPEMNNPGYRVKVTLESKKSSYLEEALQNLTRALPPDAIVKIESEPLEQRTS